MYGIRIKKKHVLECEAVIGQVGPDILNTLWSLKLLGVACLVTVTHPGRLESLEMLLLDPWILQHEYAMYAI
jgi:hypothetical protein